MPRTTVTKQSPTNRRPKKGVLSKITSMDFGNEGIKINLYGKSGSGKTTLWGTFPKPILVIVCSGGGELRSINTPEHRKTVKQLVLESTMDIPEVISYLREEEEFQTVVLDHASGLQDLVLKEILGLEEVPVQLSWGIATQQQYGQAAIKMKEILRSILSLTCNVVIVAQERDFNADGNEGGILEPYVASALMPSVVGWLNPAVDYVCQTYLRKEIKKKEFKAAGNIIEKEVETGRVEFCLRTYPSPVYASKFRVPKGTSLPECVVDPTYDKIMKLIKG